MRSKATPAHPRSRGENKQTIADVYEDAGSSPLTRGKRQERRDNAIQGRLIPAHAGKTPGSARCGAPRPAHPRSRGENRLERPAADASRGSSPLTRGKPAAALYGPRQGGLIPAHAGKTFQISFFEVRGAAHPRSRGENLMRSRTLVAESGSSPLTRGKPFLTCAFIEQIGQILESLELCASSESYSSPDAYATDALQGRVRSIGLAPRSSRGAS